MKASTYEIRFTPPKALESIDLSNVSVTLPTIGVRSPIVSEKAVKPVTAECSCELSPIDTAISKHLKDWVNLIEDRPKPKGINVEVTVTGVTQDKAMRHYCKVMHNSDRLPRGKCRKSVTYYVKDAFPIITGDFS